jgi:hypothetical protein
VFVEGIELGGDPGMHKRARRNAERDRRQQPLGNPLVAGSSLARPTDEYHVTGASPGLNRVFFLLPQRLEVLLHQWPRPTDPPRVRCVGSGLDSTPGNGVEPQWNATIRTPRGVGRLFDALKLWV